MFDNREYRIKNLLLEKEYWLLIANIQLKQSGDVNKSVLKKFDELNSQIEHYIINLPIEYPKLSDISPYEISMVQINDR